VNLDSIDFSQIREQGMPISEWRLSGTPARESSSDDMMTAIALILQSMHAHGGEEAREQGGHEEKVLLMVSPGNRLRPSALAG